MKREGRNGESRSIAASAKGHDSKDVVKTEVHTWTKITTKTNIKLLKRNNEGGDDK